jgi:hypothetical protein
VDFQLNINIVESKQKISFGDKIIFLGSCFSDEMSILAKQHGFDVVSNPFGTLFHPLAIAQNLLFALHDNEKMNFVQNDDVYLDYSCSGKVYGMNDAELTQKVLSLRTNLKKDLKIATHLFITFGTSFGYHLKETNKIVGNCHKQPSQNFTKKLTEIDEIASVWKQVISEIIKINPEIQICFTVSPVRHIKDGLHENNLSKSILILAIQQLQSGHSISYFHAYELVNDILRDYRFFKEDLVHPNNQAIKFVWEKFMATYLTADTLVIAKNVNEIKLAMNHRLQYPESKMASEFKKQLKERKLSLEIKNLAINWDV